MELAIILAIAAAIIWVLTTRSDTIPRTTGMPIFWILVIAAAVALLFELIGGGPPSDIPPS